jgi:cobalt-zinc-cadmium efflux system protein
MLAVAVTGLAVNLLAFRILAGADRDNVNLRAALLHVIGDLLGSVAAIVAALVIMGTGWTPIDPLLSVLVAVIILRSAWTVVRESGHILLEGAPRGFDAAAIAADLCAEIPEVTEVRHVHGWSISEERPMVTLEAVVGPAADPQAVRRRIKARLAARFGYDHSTVETHAAGADDERLRDGACPPI